MGLAKEWDRGMGIFAAELENGCQVGMVGESLKKHWKTRSQNSVGYSGNVPTPQASILKLPMGSQRPFGTKITT